MQPVSKEELKQLIEEAKAAGKDVSALEAMREEALAQEVKPPIGEKKEIQTDESEGVTIIESTGPAREEDFE